MSRRRSNDGNRTLGADALLVHTSLRPKTVLFGERVTAQLDVAYDSSRVRGKTIKSKVNFGSYGILQESTEKKSAGNVVYVKRQYLLECLTDQCLAPRGGGYESFPPVQVAYTQRELGPQLVEIDWPALRIRSRVGVHDFEGRPFAAELRDIPAPSYRVEPTVLVVAGYLLAAIFLVIGAGAFASAIGASTTVATFMARRRARVSALQRALSLVREASDRRERRRALDRLATELRQKEEADLAGRATGLAWRRSDPSGTTIEPLSDEVERLLEHERQRLIEQESER
jgi:hypothetical protein